MVECASRWQLAHMVGAGAAAGGDADPVARVDISFGGGRAGRFTSSRDDIDALVHGLYELQRGSVG